MRKSLKRVLLLALALLFIFETWLFNITGRAIAHIVVHVPIERCAIYVTRQIKDFSPWLTLGVFIIPAIILLPIKFTAVWLLAKGYVMGGILMILFAKILGLGVTSFLFTVCKPKLMELRAVKWLYERAVRLHAKARAFVAPYMEKIRQMMALVKGYFPKSTLRKRAHRLWSSVRKHP